MSIQPLFAYLMVIFLISLTLTKVSSSLYSVKQLKIRSKAKQNVTMSSRTLRNPWVLTLNETLNTDVAHEYPMTTKMLVSNTAFQVLSIEMQKLSRLSRSLNSKSFFLAFLLRNYSLDSAISVSTLCFLKLASFFKQYLDSVDFSIILLTSFTP